MWRDVVPLFTEEFVSLADPKVVNVSRARIVPKKIDDSSVTFKIWNFFSGTQKKWSLFHPGTFLYGYSEKTVLYLAFVWYLPQLQHLQNLVRSSRKAMQKQRVLNLLDWGVDLFEDFLFPARIMPSPSQQFTPLVPQSALNQTNRYPPPPPNLLTNNVEQPITQQ